ncbi:hypothetical protein [Puniceicoccus vermicola]|nr:hypothetical protein [Puniceicoccus vermicola]
MDRTPGQSKRRILFALPDPSDYHILDGLDQTLAWLVSNCE